MAKKQKRRIRWWALAGVILAAAAVVALAVLLVKSLFSPARPAVRKTPPVHLRNTEQGYSPVITTHEASLFMVGDALLHDTVYNDARTADGGWDFTKQIGRIGEIAEQYDIRKQFWAGKNLDCPTIRCSIHPRNSAVTW